MYFGKRTLPCVSLYLSSRFGLLKELCCWCVQVKSVLTTLSGEELTTLRDDLEQIRESFSLMEFDDEEVDDPKGKNKNKNKTHPLATLLFSIQGM